MVTLFLKWMNFNVHFKNYNNVIFYLQVVAPITIKNEITKMLLPVCEWPFLEGKKMYHC